MARLAGLIQIYSLHYMYVWKSRLYKLACVLLIIDFVDHVQKKYKRMIDYIMVVHLKDTPPKAATCQVF